MTEAQRDMVKRAADNALLLLISRGLVVVVSLVAPIALTWLISSISDLQERQQKSQEILMAELGAVRTEVALLKQSMSLVTADRYPGAAAQRDFALRDERIGGNTRKIGEVHARIQRLEDRVARK